MIPGQPQQCIVLTLGTIKVTLLTRSFNLIRFACNEGNPIGLSVLLSIRLRTFECCFMIQLEVKQSPSHLLFEKKPKLLILSIQGDVKP